MVAPMTAPMSEGSIRQIEVMPKHTHSRRNDIDKEEILRIRAKFDKPSKPNWLSDRISGLYSANPTNANANEQANNELRQQYVNVFKSNLSNSTNLDNSFNLNIDLDSTLATPAVPKVYPIRCSEVGAQYPDMFRITPAYDIKYSGESWASLASGLITSRENNIYKRIKRWVGEDKYITYCDFRDKAAALIAAVILILTFIITLWQLKTDSVVEYRYKNSEQLNTQLTKLNNEFAYVKLGLSGAATAIIMWNIFKRTTVPTRRREIKNFITAELEPVERASPPKKISAI
jgi:hypothetical protein